MEGNKKQLCALALAAAMLTAGCSVSSQQGQSGQQTTYTGVVSQVSEELLVLTLEDETQQKILLSSDTVFTMERGQAPHGESTGCRARPAGWATA